MKSLFSPSKIGSTIPKCQKLFIRLVVGTAWISTWENQNVDCMNGLFHALFKVQQSLVTAITDKMVVSTRVFSLNPRLFVILSFIILQLYYNSYLPCCEIYQHVIQMSVSQANNVTYHRHDCSGSSITLSHLPPLCCTSARTPQLSENIITIINKHGCHRQQFSKFTDFSLIKNSKNTIPQTK